MKNISSKFSFYEQLHRDVLSHFKRWVRELMRVKKKPIYINYHNLCSIFFNKKFYSRSRNISLNSNTRCMEYLVFL